MRASRLVALLSLAVAVPVALVAPQASGATVSQCTGAFCVSFDRAFYDAAHPANLTNVAASAVDVELNAVNTSANQLSNKSLWLQALSFDFGANGVAGPALADPSDLPLGAVVAGSNATAGGCSAGSDGTHFKDSCPAGYGAARVDVQNSLGHNGTRNATYGISEIVNSYHAGGPQTLQATLKIFIPNASALGAWTGSTTLDLTVSHPSQGASRITVPAATTLDLTTAFPGASADLSLGSLRMRLKGLATQTSAGTAISPAAKIVQLPSTCGTAGGQVGMTDRAAQSVTLPYSLNVNGCPSAPKSVTVSPAPDGTTSVTFGAATPTTTVAGRTAGLVWDLGDGSTSTGLSFVHAYADGTPRSLTVRSRDSAGALSAPIGISVLSSGLTVAQGTSRTITGRLTDGSATGVGDELVTVLKCATTTTPVGDCKELTSVATADDGSFSFLAPATSQQVPLAFLFDGAEASTAYPARFSSLSRVVAKATPKVTLKAADTTIKKGTSAKLSGTVTPALAGSPVLVQQYKSGAWKTIATKTLSGSSTYSLKTSCPSKGTYKYRTVIKPTASSLASVSPVLSVTAS